jgi:outer membrane lipoprotein-sorting protein
MRPLAALALHVALVSACASAPCPAPALQFTEAGAALRAHRSMRTHARVIRAEARIDRRDEGGRVHGTVLMFLERPDRVRFDAMTPLGPAAVLTSDGHTFALMDLREDRFFIGGACPENIARLTGLPLSASEVTGLLLGESPLLPDADETLDCAEGRYVITRRDPEGRHQTLILEVRPGDAARAPSEQRLRLRSSEVRERDGTLAWRMAWDDYRVVEDPDSDATPRMGVAMPFRVRFEQPTAGVDTLVNFTSIDLNAEVPDGAFVQSPRPGLSVQAVACPPSVP